MKALALAQELQRMVADHGDRDVIIEYDSAEWLEVDGESPVMVGGVGSREILLISCGDPVDVGRVDGSLATLVADALVDDPDDDPAFSDSVAVIKTPGVVGRAAQAGLTAARALGRFEGAEIDRAFVLVFSTAASPPAGMAAMSDGDTEREVHRHLFDMLLSATRQSAERAEIPFSVAAIPGGQNGG